MSVISVPTRFSGAPRRDPSPDAARRGSAVPTRPRPEERPEPRVRLEVVPKAARGARSRLWRRRALLVGGVLATLMAPFALVLVHVELTANELRLTSLQTRGDQAQTNYEKLRLQVAQLESPARVVADAQGLGMVTPTTIHYLTASPGSVAPGANPTSVEPEASPGVNAWTTAKRADAGR